MRSNVGLIVAIVVAAIVAIIVLRMQSEAPAPAPTAQPAAQQLKTVNVYVAAVPIAIGSTIEPEMLAIQPWPEHLVLEGFIRADSGSDQKLAPGIAPEKTANAVLKTVARAPFQQNEPILSTKLANPNDPNFLAGSLPKGMRVVTMAANEVEGVAGFVFPGDHVDVMLTRSQEKISMRMDPVNQEPKEEKRTEFLTEALLNNVLVVAVDQRPSSAGAMDKDGKLVIPHSVSLAVSPVEAQKVRLGQKMGVLTLALRSLADKDAVDPMMVTTQKDVAVGGGGQEEEMPSVQQDPEIVVYRGTDREVANNKSKKDAFSSGLPKAIGKAADAQSGGASQQAVPAGGR